MTDIEVASHRVDRELERLFKQHPPRYDQLCTNPVTGGLYVGGLDPIEEQIDAARRLLLAREWHALNGPPDLQPLPLKPSARDDMVLRGGTLAHYIFSKYARSLSSMDGDVKAHPSLRDYFSGVLWEAELPVGGFASLPDYGAEQLQELKKRFPPRMLKGMSPGLTWLPPKEHKEAMASLRRCSRNPAVYSDRE